MNKLIPAILAVFVLFFLPSQVAAQEITGVDVEGTCTDFTVTVAAANLTEGCWDVKLDIPGQIETGPDEWKSTFYYKNQALCHPDTQAALSLKLDSSDSVVKGTAKIRLDSKIREMDFEIGQSCPPAPEPLSGEWSLFVAFVIILIFGWVLTWWWRQGHKAVQETKKK